MDDDAIFNFFYLHPAAAKKLISEMDPSKIIQNTMFSEQFKRVMDHIKLPVRGFHLRVAEEKLSRIEIWPRKEKVIDGKKELVSFPLISFEVGEGDDENVLREDPVENVDVTLNGRRVGLKRYVGTNNYFTDSENRSVMEDFVLHMFRFLIPEKYFLVLRSFPDYVRFIFSEISRHAKFTAVDSFFIDTINFERIVEFMDLDYGNFVVFDVDPDSDDAEISNQMKTQCPGGLPLPVIADKLYSILINPFSLDQLLDPGASHIYLDGLTNPLYSYDINKLLRKWQKGEKLQNLEKFYTSVEEDGLAIYEDDSWKILKGVEVYHRNLAIENFMDDQDVLGNLGGLTIRRETDGCLAVLFVSFGEVKIRVSKELNENPIWLDEVYQ